MTLRHTLCALLLTMPLLAITGCDNMSKPASQSTQPSQIDDASLQQAVSNALQRDTLFAHSDIAVTSQRGQIRLSGTVASMQDKNRATEIAQQVAGVSSVSNSLEIITPTSKN